MQMRIDVLVDMVEDAFMSGFRVGRAGQGVLSEEEAREILAKGNLRAKLEEVVVDPVQQ